MDRSADRFGRIDALTTCANSVERTPWSSFVHSCASEVTGRASTPAAIIATAANWNGAFGLDPTTRLACTANPARQQRPDHRERLRAAIRAMSRQLKTLVDQPSQADLLREQRRRQQPRRGHEVRLIEADGHVAQIVRCSHSSSALSIRLMRSVARHIVPGQRAFDLLGAPLTSMGGGSGLNSGP